METTITTDTIVKISKSPYLTRKNLELILGSNRRTLDYRIMALIKGGLLTRIKPGVYISSEYMKQQTDKEKYLEYLGCILKQPSYVSLRYALSKYNLIPESIFDITYVTTKKTNRFDTPVKSFVYSNITEKLFFGFSAVSFGNKIVNFALPYKALFDLFYYARLADKEDTRNFLLTSRINWKNLDRGNKNQLKKILANSDLSKMKRVLIILQEEKLI